tara:strand:+ start:79226 stop:82504 length:3279 start_codon:yes stop_codon:yes gene_type:complete
MNFKNYFLLLFYLLVLFSSKIAWTQTIPPILSATGDQNYCPLSQINIVTDFNIIPGDDEIEAVFIQISENYIQGEDTLALTGLHPSISTSWSALEGKLTLTATIPSPIAYIDLIAAVKDVVFESTSNSIAGEKHFSITIDEANYLPSTDHYYEYIPNLGITWSAAKIAAEAKFHYGLQGYLATITSTEEAQLSGEQAAGAGWIGGSDAATEGVWEWVTGPENGTIFWNGGINGTTPNFAFWNTNEPNQSGDEDYTHVTAPNVGIPGSWNDLSNTGNSSGDYQPKGYIVEYGGMPGDPILNISASTKITIAEITAIVEDSNCGTGIVNLSATASLGTVLWFDSLIGGTKLGSGNTFTTPIISTATTYYAVASADGICETGNRSPIVATIYTIPNITNVTNTIICGAGIGTISAVASSGIINWYDALTGGNLVGIGGSFTSPNLTSTTTYYVDATENGCTTATRTPVVINVQYTTTPTGLALQTFCDIENANISNLTATGTGILWYSTSTGGTSLNTSTLLTNNIYYATQTINGCESPVRLAVNVSIYETVTPAINVDTLQECDNINDGDDTNGFSIFDLTTNEIQLLSGKSTSNFTITYFEDSAYLISIPNPTSFQNTTINGQTIYVRINNNIDTSCFSDNSFSIQVDSLPVINSTITFKNCDEDGIPDGFTDFNLNEANNSITNNNSNLNVSYYLSPTAAALGTSPIVASPFNNITANTVYARVENSYGCYRVATINLDVSVTSFPVGFNYEIIECDADNTIDGLFLFDLTNATQYFLTQLPPQNLSVHYYKNLTDAQLEENEILPQNAYMSETPFSQSLYVRVENDDNGDCFGIGEHLTLTVFPRPEFEVDPTAIVCLNAPPKILEAFNPNGIYNYEWTDENDTIISSLSTASVSSGGVYTVVATSGLNCESFPQTITVSESIIADITLNDVIITDDSENNTITINTTNLGIGNYEFAIDDAFGPYQDEPFFENVAAGIHTIYVQDKNNCGIAQIDVSVIGFPKFFTPNNDGINDTWQIKGVSSNFYPTSLIYIFDRFGKIIAEIDPSSEGWNGIFNGKLLTSTDYWFSVELIDSKGNSRIKKGHFSLIRR